MQPRLNYYNTVPEATNAVLNLENYVKECGIDPQLLHLIKLRASQINGCAFCIDMHTKEAKKDGETEQRLYLLSAWRESPLYTEKERAVMAWTEAITKLPEHLVSDELYENLKQHYTEEDIVKITLAINMINFWNRFSVGFRSIHPMN